MKTTARDAMLATRRIRKRASITVLDINKPNKINTKVKSDTGG